MQIHAMLATLLMTAVTATAVSAATPNNETTSSVPQNTMTAIITAVAKADLSALDQVRQQSPDSTTQLLVSMAQERIQAAFDKSNADAETCEQKLFDSDTETALFCARFRVGNLRIAGNDQEANQADLDMVKRFQSELPSDQVQRLQSYASANDNLPALTVQRPAGGFSIPLQPGYKRERSGNLGETSKRDIAVVANGHEMTMRVDTAIEYIDLDEDTARQLGVHLTDEHVVLKTSLNKRYAGKFGILDKLTFNGVTVENVPVIIVPRTEQAIGIGILKYLGAFRITKDAIDVYGPNDQRPTANDRMLIGSHIDGFNMRMIAMLTIEGAPHLTLLNTGDPYYLTGNKGALSDVDYRFLGSVPGRDIGNVRHNNVVDHTMANVVIGGQPIQMKFGIFADANMPWNYQLGRSALQDMDFYFDFQNGKAAIIPHSGLR